MGDVWQPPFPRSPFQPMSPVPPPPVPARPEDTARSFLWASVPLITLGYGTPFSFLYAAIRQKSVGLGVTAAGYGAGTATVLMLMQLGSPVFFVLAGFIAIMLWIAGTAHAFAVRTSVFPRGVPRSRLNEHAVKIAKYRRELREQARALAAEDPALARELRIGRPDMPRTYDDGGLVDVNSAPPQILAALPGMKPEFVERIVRRREEQGGFVSAEEMAVDADLPPDVLPAMAEFTLFLR
ncbi:helix-hairpin-helix domain-containing protein [Actinomadura spongiicola]|uniref:Helix-hairpin-helix domain-containing protein n=1 Tax=Actinomadura spongiicola TaxID=2303421 RepID=A0A372GL42_9ACTN|nr:helix-hairpin-helix domain-containing protein [Actinomadura spongiicola]